MITFLQHTHISLPHYDDKEWDWLRGAMATVDRWGGVARIVCACHVAVAAVLRAAPLIQLAGVSRVASSTVRHAAGASASAVCPHPP